MGNEVFFFLLKGGYDGTQNLCSVEAYDPDKDKWTLVASMQNNQGVVGVGVVPFELDLVSGATGEQQNNSSQLNSKHYSLQQCKREICNKLSIPAKRPLPVMNNYYSLMEDEDDENSIIAGPTTSNFQASDANSNNNNNSNNNDGTSSSNSSS